MTAAYLIALIIAFLLLATGLILFIILCHKRVIPHQVQMQKFYQEKNLELLQASSTAVNPLPEVPASLLNESIRKGRVRSPQLQPDMLLYLGLVKALRPPAKRINGAGDARVSVVQQINWPEPPSPITLLVYRAVQQILTNLLRHGKATEIFNTNETGLLSRPHVKMKISLIEGDCLSRRAAKAFTNNLYSSTYTLQG